MQAADYKSLKNTTTEITFTMPKADVDVKATFLGSVYFLKKSEDGTWTPVADAEKTLFEGTTYTVTDEIAKKYSTEHYVLKGYSTAYSETGECTAIAAGDSVNISANNGSLYLYYEPENCELTLYQDTAGTQTYETVSLPYNASLSGYADEKPEPQTHETFAGWSYDKDQTSFENATNIVDWSDLRITGEVKVYPIWVHDKVEVKKESGYEGAASIPGSIAELGGNINTDGITRDGYDFDGWYTQNGTKWEATSEITPKYCDKDSDGNDYIQTNEEKRYNYYTLTLIAHWTPRNIEITYALGDHPKDGEVTPANGSVTMDGTTKLADAPEPNDAYLFTGWKCSSDTAYSGGGSFTLDKWELVRDGKVTFTAQYVEKAKVKLFFDTNGGTAIEPITEHVGTDINLSEYISTRTGYTFDKWNDGSSDYNSDAIYHVPESGVEMVTLEASWNVNNYTITFDSLGGTDVNPITQSYDTAVTPPAGPTKAHYTFEGWYPAIPTTMPAEDITLKAIWEPETYIVKFMNDETEYRSASGIYGASVDKPEDPQKSGFAFDGWKDISGKAVTFPTYITDNATYTAIWRPAVKYEVTFKVVNGTWDDGTTNDKIVNLNGYEGDVLNLPADQIPAVGTKPNDNYKIGSWNETPSADTTISGNKTFTYTYAEKEKISAVVTFKVVGGSWSDGKTEDKSVTLSGYEGDKLKLSTDQIPEVGEVKGYWEETPDTESVITEDTVYTYICEVTSEPSVATAPTANELVYNGTDQTLLNEGGTAEDGTMYYAIGTKEKATGEYSVEFESLKAKNAGIYYVWYKAVGNENAGESEPQSIPVKISKADTDKATPGVPQKESSTENSITLTAHDGYEYKCNDGAWTTNNVFTDLSMDTEYKFYQRIQEVDNYNASPSSDALVIKINDKDGTTEETVVEGNKTTVTEKDSDGNPTKITETVTEGNKTTVTEKDSDGNPTKITETVTEGNKTTVTEKKPSGEVTKKTETVTNDDQSTKETVTEGNKTTVTEKDSAGNTTKITETVTEGNKTTVTEKDSAGNTTKITETVTEGNKTTVTEKNPNEEVTKKTETVKNDDNSTTETVMEGNKTTVTEKNPSGEVTKKTETVKNDDNSTTETVTEGNKTTVTEKDPNGGVTGKTETVSNDDGTNVETSHKYDTNGNETEIIQATIKDGKIIERKETKINPDGSTTVIGYDKEAQKKAADALAVAEDSEECKKLIDDAKKAIDTLEYDESKSLDENIVAIKGIITKLSSDLADKRAADKMIEAINKLPAIDKVSTTDKTAIEAARKAYDALTADQKKNVPADVLKKLTDDEKALTAAEATDKAAKELEAAKKEAQAAMNEQVTVTQKGKKFTVKWKKASSADGYYVYASYCGKKATKPAKTVKKNTTTKVTISKINGKKISTKKYFHVYVVPYKIIDGKKVKLAKSMTAHLVGTKNTRYSNVKKLTLNKSEYSVKVGKTAKIKAKVTLVNKNKKHISKGHGAKFRYKSSDTGIATVDKNGNIKGIKKGKCTIYVYSINGLTKKAKITVK